VEELRKALTHLLKPAAFYPTREVPVAEEQPQVT
jgi:hypothetical protein